MPSEPEPESPSSSTEPPEEPPVKEEPAEVVEDWATRFKYLLADFENFRKRADRERDSARLAGRADVLRSLLPLFEASEKAREAVSRLPPADPVRRGVEMLGIAWHTFLESEKVTPVARAGARFQAEWHEAVAEAPARSAADDGTVVEIVQQGYRIGSALLRPA
jgi:molecular chaperone GrpE